MIKERFNCNAVPIQLPIGFEDTFEGIVDLINNNAIKYINPDKEKGMKFEVVEIPDDLTVNNSFSLLLSILIVNSFILFNKYSCIKIVYFFVEI